MVEIFRITTESLAKASWTRCRSMADRKSGATWDSVSDAVRDAWRKGALSDLTEAEEA